MATGIQTGMRSGSRSGLASSRNAKGGGGGPLGKFKEMWGGLGKGAKIAVGVFLTVAIMGGIFAGVYSNNNKYVPLYSTKLTDNDVKEVAMKLTDMRIPHEVDIVDGILVHPTSKSKAQMQLAAHGLPRHPITTPLNVSESSISAKTEAEQRALRQRMLEGELTESVRQVDGVADAYIKLAVPEETYFKDDTKATTARVLLKMTPGSELNREQISGITHLIAFSVPDLEAENVKIVDTKGRDLSAMLPKGADGAHTSSTQYEEKTKVEQDLQNKVQEHLDLILGPGKAKATVNTELDFAQTEKTSKFVGGAGDGGTVVVGRQKKVERFSKDPNGNASSSGAEMMSATQASGGGPNKDSNYVHEVESVKVKTSESVIRSVDKSYRIKRITAAVAVDNLKDDQVSKVAGIVKNAIGIDESRGDEVTVTSMPFHRTMAVTGGEALAPPGGWGQPAAAPALSASHLGAAVSVGAFFVLGLIGMFMVKQNRVHSNQRNLVLGSTSGPTNTGIADLLNEKSGKSNAPAGGAGETKVNTTDQLEQLAKERPTKVAEMLKSTWLSG